MIFTLSFIAVIISVICTLIVIKLHVTDLIYLHSACIFLYLSSAYLAKKGNLKIARLLYFIFINTGIVATASYIGLDGGVESMLMSTLSLPFMVFSFRNEKKLIAVFSSASILLWIAIYVTNFNLITTSKIDVETESNFIYPFSIIPHFF
jgi:hypothetical protein